MTKKRLTAIVLFSPFLLAIGLGMFITSCVGYALSGKWILKELAGEWLKQGNW